MESLVQPLDSYFVNLCRMRAAAEIRTSGQQRAPMMRFGAEYLQVSCLERYLH